MIGFLSFNNGTTHVDSDISDISGSWIIQILHSICTVGDYVSRIFVEFLVSRLKFLWALAFTIEDTWPWNFSIRTPLWVLKPFRYVRVIITSYFSWGTKVTDMQCMSKGNLAVYVYVLINLISPLSVLFARFVCTLLSLLDNLDG